MRRLLRWAGMILLLVASLWLVWPIIVRDWAAIMGRFQ